MASASRGTRDEGSALILALIFIVAAGMIVAALADLAMNNLTNTSSFNQARSLQYAANSAVQVAVQSIRYNPMAGPGQTLNASPPSYCFGTGPTSTVAVQEGSTTYTMAVWCSTIQVFTSSNTRTVTLDACSSSVSAIQCAASPVLQAVVAFDDYPTGSNNLAETQTCSIYCGQGVTIERWVYNG